MPPESGKLSFYICKLLFEVLVAGLHGVVYEVLVVKGFFKILITAAEVTVHNFDNVIQLAANAA